MRKFEEFTSARPEVADPHDHDVVLAVVAERLADALVEHAARRSPRRGCRTSPVPRGRGARSSP